MPDDAADHIQPANDKVRPATPAQDAAAQPTPEIRGAGGPLPGTVICVCPRCALKFPLPTARVGTKHPCPACGHQVPVVAGKNGWGMVGCLVMALLATLCCLGNVSILGRNANSAFGTVGASIGSTVSAT